MQPINRRLVSGALFLSLLGTLPAAQAESTRRKKSGTKAKPRSGAGSRGVRLKPSPTTTYANGETPAERQRNEDARLRRECQGRPNAGACLGYAQ